MIKKIIILVILAAAGYIGYLVWNNLSEKEKTVVNSKFDAAKEKIKDTAKHAADKITGKTKEVIRDLEKD